MIFRFGLSSILKRKSKCNSHCTSTLPVQDDHPRDNTRHSVVSRSSVKCIYRCRAVNIINPNKEIICTIIEYLIERHAYPGKLMWVPAEKLVKMLRRTNNVALLKTFDGDSKIRENSELDNYVIKDLLLTIL